jgi:CheY-like chemotaxis protein
MAPARRRTEGSMARVLLVEDEPSTRAFLTEALEMAEHTVHAVANAEIALLMLEEGIRFDLLVTDILLPWGIDGIELADRAKDLRPDLKFLYVTGFAGYTGRDVNAFHGVLLTKPMRVAELHSAADEALAGGRGIASCRARAGQGAAR